MTIRVRYKRVRRKKTNYLRRPHKQRNANLVKYNKRSGRLLLALVKDVTLLVLLS